MTGNLRKDRAYLHQLKVMYPGKKFKDIMQIETQKLGWIASTGQLIISTMINGGYLY